MTTESQQYKNTESDEISLKELLLKIAAWWRYLLSKWLIILIFGIIGGVLGFTYAYIKKPIYTATTTFVLETGEKGGGLGAYAGVASMMGIDLGSGGGGLFQGDNILDLYKSRKMIEKTLFSPRDTISSTPLIERYLEIYKEREGWSNSPRLKGLKFTVDNLNNATDISKPEQRLRDSVIGIIVETIGNSSLTVAKPDKKLSIIKVDVKSIDEIFAKRFNEELVKNVNDFYIQTKTKKALDNVQILQHKTDSVRAVMNGAIYSAALVADATPNLNPTRQVQRAAPVQKAQFSAETNKAVLSEMVKNLELAKITLLKETPLIQTIDDPIYPLKKDKLGIIKGMILGIFLSLFVAIFYLLVVGGLRSLIAK